MQLVFPIVILLSTTRNGASAQGNEKDCYDGNGEEYRGVKATTKTGRKCQPWKNNSGWWTPKWNPELISNYCRNPSSDTFTEPWCYWKKTYGITGWDYCGVPKCSSRQNLERIDPTKDIIMDYNRTMHEFEKIRLIQTMFLPRILDLQEKQPTKCEQKMWHANYLPYKEYGTLEDQGTPGATEEKNANYTAAMAFESEDSYPWMSKKLPAAVWYHFNQSFTLAKISFASRSHFPKTWAQTPETFDIIGSHDCLKWDVLKTVIAAGFTGPGQTKSWKIPCSNQGEYSCYGINTTRVASSSPNYAKHGGGRVWVRVSITDIKMYY